ncbi:MAG: integrase core domain-containing protein [Pseudomonadota bacterium]
MKQQLLVITRSRRRSPNLLAYDRFLLGFWSLFLSPRRIPRTAIIIRPSTLLKFHNALRKRKYRLLFSPTRRGKPGHKGPSQELIRAIIELKQRNPRFVCLRIAQQIANTFGADIDKDLVRRVLAAHYQPGPDDGGPSWLTFLGHTKNSLWSIDLFRCESILLKSHWVLVIMDQFTRRIIGFGVHAGNVDGVALCRIFNKAVSTQGVPHFLSSGNDPLLRYHRWRANLRILGVEEIKTVPYTPLSHPFVERLIGTIRREYLDHILFWNAQDLERVLVDFRQYYNRDRVHQSPGGDNPKEVSVDSQPRRAKLSNYSWVPHCNGLFQTPIAA